MPAELRLSLLGPPQVTLGDVPVRFTRRKALALLGYLAVTGRVHTRDELAALLCDEGSDGEARKGLRNALADLSAPLGDYLLVTRETLALRNGCSHWLDVAEFEATLTSAIAADDPAALEGAVGLYRGELLAGPAPRGAPLFEEWLLLERERLRALLAEGLLALAEALARRGPPPPPPAAPRSEEAITRFPRPDPPPIGGGEV
jgi:DNA-binding SARP family transcriptional activator